MSLARVIRIFVLFAIFLWLFSLLGCATYTRQTTETKPDGTKVTKTESGVEYRPTYSYGYVPGVIVGPMSYGPWVGAVWVNDGWTCRRRHARLVGQRCYY